MVLTTDAIAEQRVILQNVDWECLEFLLKKLGQNRATRLYYSQNILEIITPLLPHESAKCSIDRLVHILCEELNLNLRSTGSLTLKREDLDRGAEPDNSYYIKNESLIRNKTSIDLSQDPPPDLIIEIEYSSSAINKLQLYAAIGVPELWRYNGKELFIYKLETGKYFCFENSSIFECINIKEISAFLEKQKNIGEIAMIKEFRSRVKAQI